MTKRVLFFLYDSHCFNIKGDSFNIKGDSFSIKGDSFNELEHCFQSQLSFQSLSLGIFQLQQQFLIPQLLLVLKIADFVHLQAQVTRHKSILCIWEMQEWANRISRVIYCASATAGRDRRGKLADVCLLMVASSSGQSPGPHTSVSQSVQLNTKG